MVGAKGVTGKPRIYADFTSDFPNLFCELFRLKENSTVVEEFLYLGIVLTKQSVGTCVVNECGNKVGLRR